MNNLSILRFGRFSFCSNFRRNVLGNALDMSRYHVTNNIGKLTKVTSYKF